ncbi:MAG TPA: hypothetical protein VHG91_16500 [Longimicrobium sp.]|nr:hypothetical protein [Longimicrobium sp.]
MSVLAALTVVRYTPGRAWRGALHMVTQRPFLARLPGLKFSRLLGTGAGIGFSAVPDLRTWALFSVWEDDAAWESFVNGSRVMRAYRRLGEETYTVLLRPVSWHGRWAGRDPFGPAATDEARLADAEPVAVLTRATLRPKRARAFWSEVAPVDATLRESPDLLLSFGVGETPWIKQGTLSVWRSGASMKAWAYRTPEHAEVVRRTRDEGWYAEELFARFRLAGTKGTFRGRDPLAEAGVVGADGAVLEPGRWVEAD